MPRVNVAKPRGKTLGVELPSCSVESIWLKKNCEASNTFATGMLGCSQLFFWCTPTWLYCNSMVIGKIWISDTLGWTGHASRAVIKVVWWGLSMCARTPRLSPLFRLSILRTVPCGSSPARGLPVPSTSTKSASVLQNVKTGNVDTFDFLQDLNLITN